MPKWIVTFVDKIWKRGGKRHHRTFVVEASSKYEAVQKAFPKLRRVVVWKPSGAEARMIK